LGALLVDLGLFRPDEGPLVDIGVDLDIRVIAELQRVLLWSAVGDWTKVQVLVMTYPLAVVDWHVGGELARVDKIE
jgi:hypothetical protein